MRLPAWVFLIALLFCSVPAQACNIPVFRYALENWSSEPYELVLFLRGELSTSHQALVDRIEKASRESANVTVIRVDLNSKLSEADEKLWVSQPGKETPWMMLRYPSSTQSAVSIWAGPLDAASVEGMLDSPARRELARRIQKGDAVIWAMVESGDAVKDEAVMKLLKAQLKKMEETLQLPEQEEEAGEHDRQKLMLSVLTISAKDPSEKLFICMLMNIDPSLKAQSEPVVFPVFGRGRILPPLIGTLINQRNIEDACEFLTGACSCEVKENNPGTVLLMSADWESIVQGTQHEAKDPPSLHGISEVAASAALKAPDIIIPQHAALAPGGHAEMSPVSLKLNIAWVVLLGFAVVIVLTVVLRSKKS